MTPSSPNGLPVFPEWSEQIYACLAPFGITFQDPLLLRQAFTHSSYAGGGLKSNERLEFLGDAVLGMIICNQLYQLFPFCREGEMTEIKSQIVSGDVLARTARALGLDSLLLLGRGITGQGPSPDSILADAFEALIAALFLDQGVEITQRFVLKVLAAQITLASNQVGEYNAKSLLQETQQKQGLLPPVYSVMREDGPEHNKTFFIQVMVNEQSMGTGLGNSKKEAEQAAARMALSKMGILNSGS